MWAEWHCLMGERQHTQFNTSSRGVICTAQVNTVPMEFPSKYVRNPIRSVSPLFTSAPLQWREDDEPPAKTALFDKDFIDSSDAKADYPDQSAWSHDVHQEPTTSDANTEIRDDLQYLQWPIQEKKYRLLKACHHYNNHLRDAYM